MASLNNRPPKSNMVKYVAVAVLAVALTISAFVFVGRGGKPAQAGSTPKAQANPGQTTLPNPADNAQAGPTQEAEAAANDLVIPLNGLSETATFYPVTIDGTKMEVLAVKASDGSIRTAFNTCEICYASGSGYYKQSGNKLVCQNCGNAFLMDQVGVVGRGGCNPYSIFESERTADGDNITISEGFLRASTKIFANWKN